MYKRMAKRRKIDKEKTVFPGVDIERVKVCINGGQKTIGPMTQSIEISPPPPVEVSKI